MPALQVLEVHRNLLSCLFQEFNKWTGSTAVVFSQTEDLPCSAGSSNSIDIIFHVMPQIKIEDTIDAFNFQAQSAGDNISSNEDPLLLLCFCC